MIFTKLFGKKTKLDEIQDKFQNLVKELNSKSQITDIEACAHCYNELISAYSSEKLITYSIKKDVIQFLKYVILAAMSILGQGHDNHEIFTCLVSISSFVQKDKDEVPNLYLLTTLILSSTNQSILTTSRIILQNFTINPHYCEEIINNHFLEIYKIGDSISKINSDSSYFLLQKCIEKIKIFPKLQLVEEIKQNFSKNSNDHLNLIATVYQYSKVQPDFNAFNQQIKRINNCSCYEILFFINNSLARSQILELCQNPNDQLGTSLLQLYLKVPNLFSDSLFLIKFLRFIDSKSQLVFYQTFQKQDSEKLKEVIEKVLPPWKYGIDCNSLLTILKNSFDSNQLLSILNQVLTSPDTEKLTSAFTTVPNFSNLISSLFETIIEPEKFNEEFSHLIQIVLKGSKGAIQCFLIVCSNNDPVNYINSFKRSFCQLIEVPNFVDHLPELSDNELLQHYLLSTDIIYPSVEKGLSDFIAYLAKSGPHEIIDKAIVEKFDNSELKKLSQLDLEKMSKGLLKSEVTNFGSVKIPSLIPKISHFTFSSLSDRFVVGKYLLEKGIINIESELIKTIGIQFLTPEIALQIIDRPKILFEVTNTTFPHKSVYQFEKGKKESFLIAIDLKFTFDFRVDQYEQEFTVLEVNEPVIKFINNALVIGDMKFPCILKKWHKIGVKVTLSGSLHINIDSTYKAVVNQSGNVTVGSRKNSPGSTFYIKAPVNFRGQIGKSVIYVDYKGFTYYTPLINALPIIIMKLLETENKEDFCLYFNSIFNIQNILSDSIDISVLLNLLRQVLIIKYDLVTEEVVQIILGLISVNGTLDWFLFKNIFVDYILWSKLHKVLLSPVCSIIQSILNSQTIEKNVIESLSLFHFFLDLTLFLNINSEQINSIIFLLSKYEEDKMSAFTIHLLKENIPKSINFIMENENSILDAIPFKFIPFLKPKIALQILQIYSKKFLNSEFLNNFDEFENMIPHIESLITKTDFWISILSIACKCSLQEIQNFRGFQLKVPKMLNVIFKLLCKLYQRDFNENKDEEIFIETLSDVICSIIFNSNDVDFYPFISCLKELAHFGLKIKNEIFNPILFDDFEPCRLPTDTIIESSSSSSNEDLILQNQNIFCLKSEQFLNGKDLWFGLKGENLAEICDEITKKNLLINISRIQNQSQQETTNSSFNNKIDKNVVFYENVIKIITNFLLRMNEEKLTFSLNNILVFGSNVDPQISIKIHQSIVFSYLRRCKPNPEFLQFLKKMIVAGWWETKLDQLFSTISIISLRINENETKTWNSISDIFKCILSLTSDYTKIQFKLYSNSVFHKKIISDVSNTMFFIYILMSDSFLSCPKSYIQEVWYNFLFSLGLVNTNELSNLIYESNSDNQNVPILQRLNEVVNSTSFFKEISMNDSNFCTILKNKSKSFYDNYITEQKQSMSSIYEDIKNIRKSNKIIDFNQSNIFYNSESFEEITNKIEKFAFNVRFNILSSRNEVDAFKLWSILPKLTTSKYQIIPSVHPISVPTLLVPFFTDCNLNDYKSYGKPMMIKMKLNENDKNSIELLKAEIPHCVDSYVSQPFFNIGWKITKQLFLSVHKNCGKLIDIDSILLINGNSEIQSVLVTCEKSFFIIVGSSVNETTNEKHIFLHNQTESLKINTFIDNCVNGYYGKSSLFNGHIVIQLNTTDIFIAVPRLYLKLPIAIEIWFTRGFSLFLKFIDKNTTDRFLQNFCINQVFIPNNGDDDFYSISFSKNICDNFFNKKKNEIECVQKKWIENKITNFEYLQILNFFADRSYACSFQYPVMPWPNKDRKMSKPMGQQTNDRGVKFARNLTIFPDEFMYKDFYSNPSIVFHFLQRIQPFTNYEIESNNGPFDDRSKIFRSIEDEWEKASQTSDSNVQELTPEFFVLPEIFMNTNHICLIKQNNENNENQNQNQNQNQNPSDLINQNEFMNNEFSFSLPKNTKNENSLSSLLRKELDQNSELEKWIDLVFGVSSNGEKALDSLNVFSPCLNRKVTTFASNEAEVEDRMIEDGVLPTQIFTERHPKKKIMNSILNNGQKVAIFSQEISIELPKNQLNFFGDKKVDDAYFYDNKIELFSYGRLFQSIFGCWLKFNDGLFNWALPFDDNFKSSSLIDSDDCISAIDHSTSSSSICKIKFSDDKSIAAVSLVGGTLIVFRCLSRSKKSAIVESIEPISCCFIPLEFMEPFVGKKFGCCAVSSHLSLAVECSSSSLFCFNISSGRFVRSIELENEIVDVEISDSFNLIVAFGRRSIEIVSINGFKITSKLLDKDLTVASIKSRKEELTVATGHIDGSIRLWSFDPSTEIISMGTEIQLYGKKINMMKLFKEGDALLAMDENGKAKVFVKEGVDGSLFQPGIVACCAGCSKKDNHYYECSMCKLYFCKNCVELTDNVAVCKNCLERVIMNSSIDM